MGLFGLELFGSFEARNGSGEPIVISSRKGRMLLAALALDRSHSMSRRRLVGLLWSDRGDTQAHGSLRQALVALRKDLGAVAPGLLVAENERISIDLSQAEVDAIEFQRLAGSDDVEALRRAAALYRGELLADTNIADPAYEDWIRPERQRLHSLAIRVFEKLCRRESGPARLEAAQRLVEVNPLAEAAHREAMQAYIDAGEKVLALRQYEVCRAMLREELAVEPAEETEALRKSLLTSSGGRNGAVVSQTDAPGDAQVGEEPSLVVLPFDAGTPETDLDSLSEALEHEIIAGLSRIKAVRVLSRSTASLYGSQKVDPRKLERELGVRYVLEGSLRRVEEQLRASAQLIDARSGHQIWAERIEQSGVHPFAILDDLAGRIVASVQTQLILAEGQRASIDGLGQDASRLLARSWQQFLLLTEQSLATCRELAERALRLEPNKGMAHRLLSVALYHQAYMGLIPWTDQTINEVHSHAKRSIEADDADEYSHWAMACAHLLRMEHERGLASLRRALEINPRCSLAYGSMGTLLAWAGQSDAAAEKNGMAIRLNPDDPTVFFRHFGLALAHYLAGAYEQARLHSESVVQSRPSWSLGLIIYAACLAQSGRQKEAAFALRDAESSGFLTESGLSKLPFAESSDRQHLLDGLRKAGLPA